MKKVTLSIVALAALAVMGFSSCKKCKDCTVTVSQTNTPDVVTTAEFCDDELEDVDGQTVTQTVGGFTQTVKYVCE